MDRLLMGIMVTGLGLTALSTGCDKAEPVKQEIATVTAPATTNANARAVPASNNPEIKAIFDTRCGACHGTHGKGDGPGAVALNPKPRNYSDPSWQKSVSDEQLRKAITLGGAAIGKSPAMPANPDLEDKPEVILGLVAIVRSFAGT